MPVVDKTSPEARGLRVKRARNLANLSRKEMCDEGSQLNVSTLKGWELGKFGGISKLGAQRLIARLKQANVECTTDWILYEVGVEPVVHLSMPHEILEADELEIDDAVAAAEKNKILEELLLFRNHYKNCIDMVLSDDAMLPSFNAGDYIAGVPVKDEALFLNKPCIVILDSGEKLCRKITKSGHAYSLSAANPLTSVQKPVLFDVKLVKIAVILWHRHPISV